MDMYSVLLVVVLIVMFSYIWKLKAKINALEEDKDELVDKYNQSMMETIELEKKVGALTEKNTEVLVAYNQSMMENIELQKKVAEKDAEPLDKYLKCLNDNVELQKKMMMQQGFTSWRSTVQKKNLSALAEQVCARDETQHETYDFLYDKFIEKQEEVKELKAKVDAWLPTNMQNMMLMTEKAKLLNPQHLHVWREKMLSDKYDWAKQDLDKLCHRNVKLFKAMKVEENERLDAQSKADVMKEQLDFARLNFDCLQDKFHVLQAQFNDVSGKWQLSEQVNAELTCQQKRLEEELARSEETTHTLLQQVPNLCHHRRR